MNWLTSRTGRMYLYGIALALGALALVYRLVTGEQLAAWLTLAASVLGVASPVMALTHMSPKESHGDVE